MEALMVEEGRRRWWRSRKRRRIRCRYDKMVTISITDAKYHVELLLSLHESLLLAPLRSAGSLQSFR